MAFELRLPDLGEGLTEAEISRWLVAEGDRVEEDDPLVEVQTDKTTVEIPSPVAGTVLKIVVTDGQVAPVGSVLVVIGEEGEQLLRAVEAPPVQEEPVLPVAVVEEDDALRVLATPLVRRLARELGVDLAAVAGTGPAGRVTESDVRAAAGSPRTTEGRRVPLRGIRRVIAERLAASHREIPAVTFVEECDFTDVDLARVVPLAMKAVADALPAFRELNARLEGDEIVYLDRIDIGLAVQTDDGLVVPVVRGCDRLTVDEIAVEAQRLADAARAGTLRPDELRGSTFSVTSAGKLGGIFVTPLVNFPEVAILGLHRVSPRPVVRDGQVVIRQMGNVSVTFDHRVVDGARAGAFCLDVIARLQSGGQPSA